MHLLVPASLHPSWSRQAVGLPVCRSSIYRDQNHLHSTSPTPKPPPTLPTQLSAPAPTAVAKHVPESQHAAAARPATAMPTAVPGLPYASVTCLHGNAAAKPQSPAGRGLGHLDTSGLVDVPVSPCPAPHPASPHGSGSGTLDGIARKEKTLPVAFTEQPRRGHS